MCLLGMHFFGLALCWLCSYTGHYYSLVCWWPPSFLCTHWEHKLTQYRPVATAKCKLLQCLLVWYQHRWSSFQWYKFSEAFFLPESCNSCRNCWLCMWNGVRAHMTKLEIPLKNPCSAVNILSPIWLPIHFASTLPMLYAPWLYFVTIVTHTKNC